MSARRRLDAELVRRGLVPSRQHAVEAIAAHRVLVNGAVAEKPARMVIPADAVVLTGDPPRFVSRGGEKLDHALREFDIDVTGLRALDAGASTGGFTDCLRQRGAAHVVALDVGHGQLHEKLRADPAVSVIERCNVRTVTAQQIGGPFDVVVADLSFISLKKVIGALVGVARPGASLVLLVKPQFEAGRDEVSRGRGVIVDRAIHDRVCAEIDEALRAAGTVVAGWTASPIAGADGNREFLVHAIVPAVSEGGES
jgi:23S rRNA (cytidine1920-2'-O)/16S rRNA (cytidine1409-2'-O)-methyltransferase